MSGGKTKRKWQTSEIKRLTQEGVSISKIAKVLGMEYKTALRIQSLFIKEE